MQQLSQPIFVPTPFFMVVQDEIARLYTNWSFMYMTRIAWIHEPQKFWMCHYVEVFKIIKWERRIIVSLMNTNESCTMMTYKLSKCRIWDTHQSYPYNWFVKTIILILQLMDTTMAEIYHNLLVRWYPTNQAVLVLHLPKQLLNSGQIYESKDIHI